ncbi:MAG: EcsC family protein [Neisseria meningitidis]|nr:EcsC family protein [Neisseria meningitidis]
MENKLTEKDLEQLTQAVLLLETPSLTTRITDLIGTPIEWLIDKLPNGAQKKINKIATTTLYKVIDTAELTMADDSSEASPWLHKTGAFLSGAIGGFFGFSALLIELPVSTTIMMRSVLDIARAEGFSIKDPKTKLACLEVFSFTGNTDTQDDNAESGYYITRAALTEITNITTAELTKIIAERTGQGLQSGFITFSKQEVGSILARLIDAIATRFGVVLTEKTAAQLVPALGAITAATLNTMFTDFYQDMARGHFTVKRLEQNYGEELIKKKYHELRKELFK